VTLNINVFLNMILCSLTKYIPLRRAAYPDDGRKQESLKNKIQCYQTPRRHIPQDDNLYCHIVVVTVIARSCHGSGGWLVQWYSTWGTRTLDCGFESRRGHGYLSPMSVVCCQVEVSALGWSLVQRSPTEWCVSECGRENLDNEEALAHQEMLRHEKEIC
jgi:hypothetical protein